MLAVRVDCSAVFHRIPAVLYVKSVLGHHTNSPTMIERRSLQDLNDIDRDSVRKLIFLDSPKIFPVWKKPCHLISSSCFPE